MTTAQKIDGLKKQARKLWPKYDPDLDSMINGRDLIHKYLNNIFDDCKLKSDLEQLKRQQNLDKLID